MKPTTELDIAAYVLGDASEELRTRISAEATANAAFAAELDALRALVMPVETRESPSTADEPETKRVSRRRKAR